MDYNYLWIELLQNICESLPRYSQTPISEVVLVLFANMSPLPHPLRNNAVWSLREQTQYLDVHVSADQKSGAEQEVRGITTALIPVPVLFHSAKRFTKKHSDSTVGTGNSSIA
jgi:hypothetical protein